MRNNWNWKRITTVAMTAALLGLGQAAWSGEGHDHAQAADAAIESASTPAQHEALAADFRAKAEEQRAIAKRHRAMKGSYELNRHMATAGARMEKHCDRLIELAESEATEYDAMAAEHAKLAKGVVPTK